MLRLLCCGVTATHNFFPDNHLLISLSPPPPISLSLFLLPSLSLHLTFFSTVLLYPLHYYLPHYLLFPICFYPAIFFFFFFFFSHIVWVAPIRDSDILTNLPSFGLWLATFIPTDQLYLWCQDFLHALRFLFFHIHLTLSFAIHSLYCLPCNSLIWARHS